MGVVARGYLPALEVIEVTRDPLSTDFVLSRGRWISGRVVDSRSGERLDFVKLTLHPGSVTTGETWRYPGRQESGVVGRVECDALTDKSGRFSISGLLEGEFTLTLKRLGYAWTEVKVIAGMEDALIELQPSLTLRVIIENWTNRPEDVVSVRVFRSGEEQAYAGVTQRGLSEGEVVVDDRLGEGRHRIEVQAQGVGLAEKEIMLSSEEQVLRVWLKPLPRLNYQFLGVGELAGAFLYVWDSEGRLVAFNGMDGPVGWLELRPGAYSLQMISEGRVSELKRFRMLESESLDLQIRTAVPVMVVMDLPSAMVTSTGGDAQILYIRKAPNSIAYGKELVAEKGNVILTYPQPGLRLVSVDDPRITWSLAPSGSASSTQGR
ncbi:MAG: hypothetical protein ABFS86_09990 [Planctomycetota bacterium]